MPPKQLIETEALTLRADGRYQKKVRGKVYYFGTDPEDAMRRWKAIKGDLLSGQDSRHMARIDHAGSIDLKYLCDVFLEAREAETTANPPTLTVWTWHDYRKACKLLVKVLGKHRAVSSL